MQVSGSGPLGVLLMIAPLAAIPVFAILGVPHFAPVVASGTDDEEFAVMGEPDHRGSAVSAPEPAASRSPNDLYAPVDDLPARPSRAKPQTDLERRPAIASSAAGRARSPGRRLPPPDALDQWEVQGDGNDKAVGSRSEESDDTLSEPASEGFDGLAAPSEELDDHQVPADDFNPDLLKPARTVPARITRAPAADDMTLGPAADRRKGSQSQAATAPGKARPTGSNAAAAAQFAENAGALAQGMDEQSGWQDAAQRLKKLGIRKYRLESRIDEQNFVFTCTLASADNPQVVRRFEADADNPLEAVQLVLEQIDEWRSRNRSDGPIDSTE